MGFLSKSILLLTEMDEHTRNIRFFRPTFLDQNWQHQCKQINDYCLIMHENNIDIKFKTDL
jgi:hypothetical protein